MEGVSRTPCSGAGAGWRGGTVAIGFTLMSCCSRCDKHRKCSFLSSLQPVRQSKWLLFYLINLIFACSREICGLVFAGLSCLIHNLLWNEGQIHQQLIEPSGEIIQESAFRRMRTGIPSRKSLEINQPNFRIRVIIVRVNPSCKKFFTFQLEWGHRCRHSSHPI